MCTCRSNVDPTMTSRRLVITEMQNPITRSLCRLEPPYRSLNQTDLNAFVEAFDLHCQRSWESTQRVNPTTVDPYALYSPIS